MYWIDRSEFRRHHRLTGTPSSTRNEDNFFAQQTDEKITISSKIQDLKGQELALDF